MKRGGDCETARADEITVICAKHQIEILRWRSVHDSDYDASLFGPLVLTPVKLTVEFGHVRLGRDGGA